MENEYEELSETLPVEGPTPSISWREVKNATKKAKANKAEGKLGVTIEMIKALEELGVEWTYSLLEKICSTGKMHERKVNWLRCTSRRVI